MTKFKKCDDCGITLTSKNKHRIKTKGGFAETKSTITTTNEQGQILKEIPTIIFLCNECYEFHKSFSGNSEGGVRKGSSLDKILDKHSDSREWKKAKEMDEMIKNVSIRSTS